MHKQSFMIISGVFVCIALSLNSTNIASAQDASEESNADLILSLESPNTFPIVGDKNRPLGIEQDAIFPIPPYSTCYDWEAQDRITKALKKLRKADLTHEWDLLVSQFSNNNYCQSFAFDSGEITNSTVSDHCKWIASSKLYDVFSKAVNEHIPSQAIPRGARVHIPLYFRDVGMSDLMDDHPNAKHYELQLMIGKMYLNEVESSTILSEKYRTLYRDRVNAIIQKIESEQKPQFGAY